MQKIRHNPAQNNEKPKTTDKTHLKPKRKHQKHPQHAHQTLRCDFECAVEVSGVEEVEISEVLFFAGLLADGGFGWHC